MNILIVGSGGREHALAWKIASSPLADRVFVAPGNAGTHREPDVENVAIGVGEHERLVGFARTEAIDLVVVGPEKPLVAGLADELSAAGISVFGPHQQAAALEGSKEFAKVIMREAGVPTADYRAFNDTAAAEAWLATRGGRVVVKADGLAGGKGVTVCDDLDEAIAAVRDQLVHRRYGAASRRVIVEERLEGPEVSLIAVAAGTDYVLLPTSRDHKRRFDGDEGPNTGGMGAFCPVPELDEDAIHRLGHQVIAPVLTTMAARGTPFTGFLYAGLMMTAEGPRVLEFNVRCGDPETEALMMALDPGPDGDLLSLLTAAVQGRLATHPPLTHRPSACVIIADEGYPNHVETGKAIDSIALDEVTRPDVMVFHCGTRTTSHGSLVSAGGRVLAVTAAGTDGPASALTLCYDTVDRVAFEGSAFRRDIGANSLVQERTNLWRQHTTSG